ncbi:MAG: alpha/beta hydrolase [Chloroflexi bacterium]|nr:alpha/beta hydrolase [Chloroflexota bacterium]
MKRGYVDTPEGQVYYVEDGSGEPLVLLHEAPRSSRMYAKLLPLLARDYRVVALDMLGAGNSDPMAPNARLEDLARCVVHALDGLLIRRCHLFGLRTGTVVAGEVAAGWPDRVESLVLFSYPWVEDSQQRETIAARIAGLPLESSTDGSHLQKIWMKAYSEVLKMWFHVDNPGPKRSQRPPLQNVHDFLPSALVEFMDRWVLDWLQSRACAVQRFRASSTYDAASRLPLILAPTLLIATDSPFEESFLRHARKVASLIQRCETVTLPNSDRNAAELRAEALAEVIAAFVRRFPLYCGVPEVRRQCHCEPR